MYLRLETDVVRQSMSPIWRFLHVFPVFKPEAISDLNIKIYNKVKEQEKFVSKLINKFKKKIMLEQRRLSGHVHDHDEHRAEGGGPGDDL